MAIVVAATILKLILASLTPLGSDYASTVLMASSGNLDLSWSPWILLVRSIYLFWAWLPVHQGIPAVSSTSLSSDAYLLSAMIKTPIIASDLLTAWLVYRLGGTLGSSGRVARWATVIWLANPLVTFLGEMWGGLDLVLVFFTVLCVALVLSGRHVVAAVPLAFATALRLSPIVAWLGVVIWVIRKPKNIIGTITLIISGPVGVLGYLFWVTRGQLSVFLDLGPLLSTYSPVTQPFYQYTSTDVFGSSPVFGFAVASVLIASFLALEMWRMSKWSLIGLIAMEFLLLFGFAVWPPTAFLWVMPYLALWHAHNRGKLSYWLVVFFAAVAVSILVFSGTDITANLSFLFIPLGIVPFGKELVAGIQSSIILMPSMWLLRSIIVGFLLAYALLLFWKGLGERSL
jgi:hypothetical protein